MRPGSDSIFARKLAAFGVAAIVAISAQTALAEVRVSGKPDAIVIEARDASVEEVLAALRTSFKLQYRLFVPLDRPLTGTYSGPLPRILARLLEGQNYVLQSTPTGGELVVLGTTTNAKMRIDPFSRTPTKSEEVAPPSGPWGWDGSTVDPRPASAPPPPKTIPQPLVTVPAPPSSAPARDPDENTSPSALQGWRG